MVRHVFETLPAAATALLLICLPLCSGLSVYMSITGEKQGVFKPTSTNPGKQPAIIVLASSRGVIVQTDAGSVRRSTRRNHLPLNVTKPLDKTSPQLYKALVENEQLSSVVLEYWGTNSKGVISKLYSVALRSASIIGMYQEDAGESTTETITFQYQAISWTWHETGASAADTVIGADRRSV
mmetsp:Transcript_30352/g.67301  ORF Transcript_30352/g.67301 Transcript_30352/m.67301 type:complete len:182 (-) Transcript_30352:1296-1841(-)